MRQKNRILLSTFLLVWVSAAGCAGKMSQPYAFPAEWPSGLVWSGSTSSLAAPPEPVGPPVAVEKFTLETGTGVPASGPSTTAQMLTNLMVEKLKAAGVQVSDDNAEYTFRGTVPKLGYTERGGYPRKLYYTSELVYRLVHRPTGSVVWEGNLSQDFEQTVLVNTMTRMPKDPDAPEHVLLDKCIGPNWEIIAADVRDYLKKSGSEPKK